MSAEDVYYQFRHAFVFEFGIDTSHFFDGRAWKTGKHGAYSRHNDGYLYNL